MKLKSFKNLFCLLIFSLFITTLNSEEKIDIWKNNENKETSNVDKPKPDQKLNQNKFENPNKINQKQTIKIEDNPLSSSNEVKIFGVYDPEDFNFDLNMWTSTSAEDVRSSIKRLKRIELSETSKDILEKILLSFSYPPDGMTDEEFVYLKINWLIENDRINTIEDFLKQNQEFKGKDKVVQYLVDKNISQADIKKGCERIKFIDSTIKDSYLEKFKIYCLVFNNKNSQAQLLLDLLREQNQSDKFFDDKINYLLGITTKTSEKINEKNLLNFYLSSLTIKDFKYQPTKKTKKEIWKYLNSANLIKLEDINDKEKIKELELAANSGQVDEKTIFGIYKQVEYNLNTLINAKNIYQTLKGSDGRALIYQKYLLSEDLENKLEYLFILDELFKKDKIDKLYSNFLSEKLKEIGLENIPDNYKEIAQRKIITNEEISLGKIRYNDRILHQSKLVKFYVENDGNKKIQKDIDKIIKKINKNKKYFFSAKDLALVESLKKDGFKIPTSFDYSELAKKYEVPKNLFQLIEKNQNAFLALKIVEIIGEDEPSQLDPETIYFVVNLLNEMDLIEMRNKVLISALPLRV